MVSNMQIYNAITFPSFARLISYHIYYTQAIFLNVNNICCYVDIIK